MATINLRAYNREIESLIEHNQNDEAIAHCLHILQFVPKHVATYRLLGKALLESKRYGDAIDIFQRLLSSVPDDYVAHVGMSIIREDEGKLDSAIWHMERAFETQPSSAPIQDELRRLYGQRDGLMPPKVRLTRGALARMYIKGMLYPQAIAELRAALADDPHRPDLQVLLAQAYYLSGQTIEAVNTCNELLKKLPYCMEANRIMAAILPEDDQSDEVKAYRQRLISLDPYYSKISPQSPNTNEVPDKEVVVDHLDYRPGLAPTGAAAQPSWAASLGVEVAEGAQPLPDWLKGEGEAPPALLPESEAELPQAEAGFEAAAALAGEEEIPDWLKSAGWQTATGPEQPPPPLEELPESEISLEIEPGEVPEWMKDLAPSENLVEEIPPEAGIPEGEIPAWLQEEEPGASDSVVMWLGGKKPQELAPEQEIPAEGEALPDWLSSLAPESAEAPAEPAAPGEALPDWLQAETAAGGEAGVAEPASEVPGWLEEGEPTEEKTGVTDWLERQAKLRAAQAQAEEAAKEGAAPSEEIPEWLKEFDVEIPAEEMPTMVMPVEEAPAEPAEALEEEAAAEIPDWLKGLEIETPAEEAPAFTEPAPEIPVSEEESALAWLDSLVQGTGISEEQLMSQPEEVAEAPADWKPEELAPAVGEAIGAEEVALPDWLLQSEEVGVEELTAAEPSAEVPQAELPAAAAELSDQEAALAWLESLAEKQGVPEEQLLTTPAERPAEAPEWVLETLAQEEAAPEIPAEAAEAELPEWLKAAEEVPAVEMPAVQETASQEMEQQMEAAFEWLEDLARKQGVPEDQLETHPLKPLEEPPAWVKEQAALEETSLGLAEPVEEAAAAPEAPVEIPAEAEEAPPAWLMEEEAALPPSLEEAQPAVSAEEPAPAWVLESEALAAEQPAEGLAEKLDINQATLSQLEALPGIGFVLAQAILEYRDAMGAFSRLDDLLNVPGISADRLEMIQDLAEVVPVEAPAAVEAPAIPKDKQEALLFNARNALLEGDLPSALEGYIALVERQVCLEEVVKDLQEALYSHPRDVYLLQTLGDAYLRLDQLQEALNAYIQAEELLG